MAADVKISRFNLRIKLLHKYCESRLWAVVRVIQDQYQGQFSISVSECTIFSPLVFRFHGRRFDHVIFSPLVFEIQKPIFGPLSTALNLYIRSNFGSLISKLNGLFEWHQPTNSLLLLSTSHVAGCFLIFFLRHCSRPCPCLSDKQTGSLQLDRGGLSSGPNCPFFVVLLVSLGAYQHFPLALNCSAHLLQDSCFGLLVPIVPLLSSVSSGLPGRRTLSFLCFRSAIDILCYCCNQAVSHFLHCGSLHLERTPLGSPPPA